jgi:phosphoglycolate phosphatase-like HAD superfamily hydrolase
MLNNISVKSKKSLRVKKLIMFDHDGTLCDTNENAYESIKYATNMAFSLLNINMDANIINWQSIFSETTGTTEKYFVEHIANIYSVPLNKRKWFEERYYKSRTKWYQNMSEFNEYVWDTYYPDAEKLLIDISKIKTPEVILSLVTGNPSCVITERIPQHIKNHFYNSKKLLQGTFGEEGVTRKELLLKNIEKAKNENSFIPRYDKNNFITNAYYIADSKNDLYAGIEAKVNIIWIPSRSLQIFFKETSSNEIKIYKSFLPDNFLTTNNLTSEEVYKFLGI